MNTFDNQIQAKLVLADVIETMPAELSRVFVLAYVQRKKRHQIAAMLNLDPDAVLELQVKALMVCTQQVRERLGEGVLEGLMPKLDIAELISQFGRVLKGLLLLLIPPLPREFMPLSRI